MNKNLLKLILGAALGMVLAINGLTILTWGFWVVFFLALAMRLVGDE